MSVSPGAEGTEELKRNIGVVAATGSGVAVIIGAGVYVLVGEAAGKAGNAIWASFLLAGTAAFFTALSYAELSAKFPRAASGL
jgi:APA family basic amino acid/polyamine antiporter